MLYSPCVLTARIQDSRIGQLVHLVQDFLKGDQELNNGRAARIWPELLQQSYPCLAGGTLVHMICQMVLRSHRNQAEHQGAQGGLQDFMEVFCGKANLTKEMMRGGFHGSAYDIQNLPDHDVLESGGLRLMLDSLSMIARNGLVWIATQRASFVILCRHQSQRCCENNWLGCAEGAASPHFVKVGNYLMEATGIIYLLAFLCGLNPVLEQPVTSCMMLCPSLRGVFWFTKSKRVVTYMGQFEGPSVKPLQLATSWDAIENLRRPKPASLADVTW